MAGTSVSEQSATSPREGTGLPLPTRVFGRVVFYGWYLVLAGIASSALSSGIQAYGLGTFIRPMTDELGWSRTDISLGQTVSMATSGILALFIGGLLDRRGGRLLMVIGAVVGGLGYFSLGFVQTLWQYYLIKGVLLTVGVTMLGPLVVNVAISNWFVQRRGRAIAIAAMGLSLGAFIVPSLAAWLIERFGWRTAWMVFGVAVWVVMIPVAAIVIRRRPEDHGLEPDGGWTSKRATSALDQKRAAVDRLEWTRAQTLRTPTLWMLILVFGLASLGIGALLLHLVAYLRDVGYSTAEAAFAFSMIGLSGLISKPIWGLIVERVPTRFVAAAEFVLLGVGIGLVMVSPTLWMTAASIFVFGVGVGGTLTVQETVWADYYGRRTLGVVRSIGRPFTVVFSAGGPVAAGLAYDLGGSYEVAFVVFIAAYLLAAVLVLFTPEPRHPGEGETRPAEVPTIEGLAEPQQS